MSELKRGGLRMTEQQAAVVDRVLDPANRITVVEAGAGSGKTHTTVATVLELIQSGKATMDQFVLITFTKKAAGELKGRMESVLKARLKTARETGDQEAVSLWEGQLERLSGAFIGTIHGFCVSLLKAFGYEERVARESDVTFAGKLLYESLFDEVEADLTGGTPSPLSSLRWDEYHLLKIVRAVLETIRNRGWKPDDVSAWTLAQNLGDAGQPYRQALATLVARVNQTYTERKQEKQVMDAGDLLTLTADMLTKPAGAAVLDKIRQRRRYMFVDEFQDTDRTQKRIIDALLPVLQGILLVGDPKQGIYDWRGAEVSLMEEIREEYKVPRLSLSLSRRPTLPLLLAQNQLFASIAATYPKLGDLLAQGTDIHQPQGDPPPMVYVTAGALRQADCPRATESHIRLLLTQRIHPNDEESRPIEPGDIAILVRSNWQMDEYETYLQEHGLPVKREGGGRFYAQEEVIATYRMLRLVLHYPDDRTMLLALETPYLRTVDSAKQQQWLLQYGSARGNPLTDWVTQYHREIGERIGELRRAVRSDTVTEFLTRLYRLFAIEQHYAGNPRAMANLQRLWEIARDLCDNEQALDLWEFADYLKLGFETGREEEEGLVVQGGNAKRPDHIRLMTVHGAKGLEFPVVIIPDVHRALLRSDLLPEYMVVNGWGLEAKLPAPGVDETRSPRFFAEIASTDEARLQEEMRIFYVAVTRAMHMVSFVGGTDDRIRSKGDRGYSWRDEIGMAWPSIPGAKVM